MVVVDVDVQTVAGSVVAVVSCAGCTFASAVTDWRVTVQAHLDTFPDHSLLICDTVQRLWTAKVVLPDVAAVAPTITVPGGV